MDFGDDANSKPSDPRLTPIIFLTQRSAQVTIWPQLFRGDTLGAVGYLFKPIEPEMTSKVGNFVDTCSKKKDGGDETTSDTTRNSQRRT